MQAPRATKATSALSRGDALTRAFSACAQHLRRLDQDRYFACLFAPAASQAPLFALYAFNAEIARIRDIVSEPMPGEIRHQWWREALSCGRGLKAENPIAFALTETMQRFRLPPDPLLALIEARSFDLYDDPMPTWLDLEGYCGETSSALIRLACLILAEGEDPGSADLCGHAGVAYAVTGLLRAFPVHARRHQCFIPHEVLIACGVSLDAIFAGENSEGLAAALGAMRQRAETHLAILRRRIGELPKRIRPAFFPACLIERYLAQLRRPDYRPFETRIDITPLAKLWCLGRSALSARLSR